MIRFIFFIYLLSIVTIAQAQTAPQGKFLNDTIKIGEPVKYSLVFKHKADKEIFFPDSSYNFAPFEYIGKTYFPTYTQNAISTDSVVYELTSFELDSVQFLALPVFILNANDTSKVYAEHDSILLQQIVKASDSTQLVENTAYQQVEKQLNYPYVLIGIISVVVLGGIIVLVFGGRIRKAYKLRRLKRYYERFINEFNKNLSLSQDSHTTERNLGIWKSYMENLQNIPFTSYTSKEISEVIHDEKLNDSLKNIDRAIYGGRINEQTRQSLDILKNYASSIYENKVKEVRNA